MAYDQVKQYDEDSAHTTGDKGMQILGVRNDSATALSGTDGDYTPMATDSAGRVGISDLGGTVSIDDGGGSLTVDGTVAVSGTVTVTATNLDVQSGGADLATSTQAAAIQTSVQLIDDAVQVLGTDTYTEATSKGITLGAVRRDADTTLVNTTNEFTPLQVDANGRLKVEAFSGETLPVSLTSTTITGTVAVTQSGTWDEVGINDSGNSITVDNSTLAVVGGGTEATAMRVTIASDSTGVLSIDDNGGSITVDGTVTATNPSVIVDDAAFTPASTSVTMVGATFDDTTPDSVNEGDGGAVRMSGNRNLYTTIRDAAGNERGVNVTASNAMTVDGSAVTQPVSAASLPLPTGASTSANQTTIIGHLDGVEGLLTTIDTDTGNIVTSVQLLDDVVATDGSAALTKLYQVGGTDGTNAQIMSTNASGHVNIADGGNSITVDGTVAATQSGTWNIGTVTTVTNVVHVDDNSSTLSIDDGGGSITVDGTVTATNPSVIVDDAAFTPASTSVTMLGATFDDVTPDSVNEGDGGAIRMSANRNLYTTLRDAAGNERGANVNASNQLTVSVDNTVTVASHAVTNAGTFVVQENGAALTSLQLIDDTVYTDDTSTHSTGASKGILFMAAATPTDAAVHANDIGSVAMTVNRELLVQVNTALPAGTNAIGKLAANSGVDIGDVDITSIIPGTGATNLGKAEDAAHASGDVGVMALAVSNEANTARAADGDYLPIATDTEGNVRVVGNRDHDAVDAGEVVGTGGRAIAHGTNPTAVAAADRTAWYFNRAGVPFVIAGHPNIVTVRANYTAAQTDTAIVTVASGLKIVVTRCSVTADNANTVDVQARIGFGATTTPTTTGVVLTHPGIAAGSGVIEGNGSGILGVGADGEDLRITSEVPTTGSIDVVVSYYTIES